MPEVPAGHRYAREPLRSRSRPPRPPSFNELVALGVASWIVGQALRLWVEAVVGWPW